MNVDKGDAVTRTEYKPYGETWVQEGDKTNRPKFNSQELDPETGYYFYNARYYEAEIGRFVTADNVIDGEYSTQGWNRFSYVKNNPVRYKDPSGHERDYTDFLSKYKSGEYETEEVTMKKGDSISKISKNLGVDQELILQMNNVKDPKKLNVGTKILLPKDIRPLTNGEIHEAKKVYGKSIDYDKVVIFKDSPRARAYGLDGVGPIRADTNVDGNIINLNQKDTRYKSLVIAKMDLLIHELGHVWQYQSSGNSKAYMRNAVVSQAIHGDKAYDYEKSEKTDFKKLNAEQQAQYLQDYYKDKYMYETSSKNYDYKEKTINEIQSGKIKYGQ